MAQPSLYVKAGDERPTLEHTCTRGRLNPQPVDLTDAESAHLYVQTEAGDLIIDAAATIADASEGVVEYDFAENDLFEPGQSDYEFVITWSTTEDETFPKQGYGKIVVDETLNRTIEASELGPDDAEVGVLTADEVNTDILGPDTTDAVTWDGDQDADGHDLENAGSVSTADSHPERVADDYHFAGAYDGSDADVRLDNAISTASNDDRIFLETSASYNDNRTISKDLTFVGVCAQAGGTSISGIWTFDGEVSVQSCLISGEIILNTLLSEVAGCRGSGTISVDADRCRIYGCDGLTVSFSSGNSNGVVDSSTNMAGKITDNDGGNLIGDVT